MVQLYRESNKMSVRSTYDVASNNLFGSIGVGQNPLGTSFGFIPMNGQGGILDLQDTSGIKAQWLGLSSVSQQFWAYNYCSPLASVINRIAEADSNGIIEFINKDGTTVESVNKSPRLLRISNLLASPNPRQTWEELDSEQVVFCKMYGYCPVWFLGPAGFDKSYSKMIINLNPFTTTPEYNYSYDPYSGDPDNQDMIKFWNVSILGKTFRIPSEDILLLKDGFIESSSRQGLPISKMTGLDYWVSNICAALEADNVLLKKKGPLGVFSYDPRPDMAGWQPMTAEAKDDVQQDLAKYGLTWAQLQYVISKTPIKWNPMSFNVQELMTKETVRQGIDGICDTYGYPAELMSGKNATYENRTSAEKFLYQTVVIPFALRRMARYNKWFGLTDVTLTMDYDHLPVLQEDIMHAGQAAYADSQALSLDWLNGIITYNEYRLGKGMDKVSGMDIHYNEYLKKYPPPAPLKKEKTANATKS